MIPKRAFMFWGNKTMSWLRYMTLYSFCKLNPDWKIELYLSLEDDEPTEKYWVEPNQQDFFSFSGKDYFDRVEDLPIEVRRYMFPITKLRGSVGPSHRSNFFKWQQLAEGGGVYIDMDILFTRPMSSFYDQLNGVTDALCHDGLYFAIGFMASSGSSPFFEEVFVSASKRTNPLKYQSAGVFSIMSIFGDGPNAMKRIEARYPARRFLNIPMNIVYPWRWNQSEKFFNELHTELPPKTIGIHWFAGGGNAQIANSLLTEENFRDYPSTFTHFAGKVIG